VAVAVAIAGVSAARDYLVVLGLMLGIAALFLTQEILALPAVLVIAVLLDFAVTPRGSDRRTP
jgi:hypothetical protein